MARAEVAGVFLVIGEIGVRQRAILVADLPILELLSDDTPTLKSPSVARITRLLPPSMKLSCATLYASSMPAPPAVEPPGRRRQREARRTGIVVPALSIRRTFVYEARSTSMANVVVAASAVFVNLCSSMFAYCAVDCSSVVCMTTGAVRIATDPATNDGASAVTVIASAMELNFISVASPTDTWLGIFTERVMVCIPSSSNFS